MSIYVMRVRISIRCSGRNAAAAADDDGEEEEEENEAQSRASY